MFNGEFKEKNINEIEVEDVTADAFQDNYVMLMDVAIRFLAVGVLDNVRLFVLEHFDTLDKFDLLEIAIKHNLKDIKEKLRAFVGAHQARLNGRAICSNGHPTNECRDCTAYTNWKVSQGNLLNQYSILKIHKDRILTLSPEAKIFILESLINGI